MNRTVECMADDHKAETPETVTVRVTKESARLLRLLSTWEDATIAEWFTENIDPVLNEHLDRLQAQRQADERRKKK